MALAAPSVNCAAAHTAMFDMPCTLLLTNTTWMSADTYVGGLAEPPKAGSQLGPLFAASIREQFARLRDADYWYYENGAANKLYSPEEIEEIRTTGASDVLSNLKQTGDFETRPGTGEGHTVMLASIGPRNLGS